MLDDLVWYIAKLNIKSAKPKEKMKNKSKSKDGGSYENSPRLEAVNFYHKESHPVGSRRPLPVITHCVCPCGLAQKKVISA